MSPALPISIAFSASSSWFQCPPGKAPLVIVIAEAIAPPTKKPLEKGWRMLRDCFRSSSISELWTFSS